MSTTNNPPTKTRAQRDTRADASITEHHHVLTELVGRMATAEERSTAFEDHSRSAFAKMRQSFTDLKLMIASQTAQHPEATRSATGILGSGSSISRTTPTSNQGPRETPTATLPTAQGFMTEERETTTESRENRHLYRIERLDFRRFSGVDMESWIFQCEHYFEVDITPEDAKLKVVVIHLDGEAFQWQQGYIRIHAAEGNPITCSGYVEELKARFGDELFEDPMLEMRNLRQQSSLADSQRHFDGLPHR